MTPAKPTDDAAASPSRAKPSSKPSENAPAKANENGQAGGPTTPVVMIKARRRAQSKPNEPTLLTDFLRGKQTPTRVAAERKRRISVEAVKAELRQEMRQHSVRRLQEPGGVRERVSAWQKQNSKTMAAGDPSDAASEPTEVAFQDEDFQSVTEEDRVRIKLRQRKRSAPSPKSKPQSWSRSAESNATPTNHDRSEPPPTRSAPPPKKRVISDGHWRKGGSRGSPPRKGSPSANKPSFAAITFLGTPALAGSPEHGVSNKVQEWVASAAQSEKSQSPKRPSPGKLPRHKTDSADSASDITATRDRNERKDAKKSDTANKDSDKSKQTANTAIQALPWKGNTTAMSPVKARIDALNNDKDHGAKKQRDPQTPTKSARNNKLRSKVQESDISRSSGDDTSCLSSHLEGSEVASSLANKSIASIAGDIPFGHSAFSELDLPLHGEPRSRPKRPRNDGSSSLRASMPKVFKKVVEESKKIIHEMNEPPRPAAQNKPPSIEKWLNTTVDPFVDDKLSGQKTTSRLTTSTTPTKSADVETTPRRNNSHTSRPPQTSTPVAKENVDEPRPEADRVSTPEKHDQSPATPTRTAKDKTPTSTGLKRSDAIKGPASPSKFSKRPFLGVLREAFTGESVPYPSRPKTYESRERRYDDREEDERAGLSDYLDDEYSDFTESEITAPPATKTVEDVLPLPISGPRFRPPTNGDHELSTIMSEESSSVVDSDLSSDLTSNVTTSTATQSTVLTSSDTFKSKQNVNHAPGLKRRLTKHSDLVSVLSLPDDAQVPEAVKSNRSRPSLRRKRLASGDVTAHDLLKEFTDDENLYNRELKTLVDGIVPVLLSNVIDGKNATQLFGPSSSNEISDAVSKSVVSMGVALERLKNAHKKAPTTDIRRMANWAHGVVPMYDKYLSAWRLGFEDIVVNLAPAADVDEGQDSLLNALPRNAKGDVVNAQGERVAVAHLLKRPLVRVKQITKLMRCVATIVDSQDTHDLLRDFESLQDKARRRFREETARITDEEAANTDTARCRDLGSLETATGVAIDGGLQVSAKDVFSLSMAHSSGQRLDCQVELVHRDSQRNPDDKGDLLIRDIGEGNNRSYLLFPPISMSSISARTGDSEIDMIVMVRGNTKGKEWTEYFTLVAEDEDQVLDWLDLLPLSPAPPTHVGSLAPQLQRSATKYENSNSRDAKRSPISQDVPTTKPKSGDSLRQDGSHRHTVSLDGVNRRGFAAKNDTTPEEPRPMSDNARGRPLKEEMRPDFSYMTRDEMPPTPPMHRSLSPAPLSTSVKKNQPKLCSVERKTRGDTGLKRRTSSPLKHEVLAQEMPSPNLGLSEDSDEEFSSDDEIESIDIPHTELGVSIINNDDDAELPTFADSQLGVADSEISLTPSNSASQAGLHGQKVAHGDQSTRFMASISRWSDKGAWRDISPHPVCIVVTAGLIEAYIYHMATGGPSDQPILSLDLTPLVLIRQSTAVDLEIRSSLQPQCKLHKTVNGGNFRFRCSSAPECFNLYMSVHHARLNNQKFIELENQARFKSFGEHRRKDGGGDVGSTSGRRSWFGRKNSYRGSVRAPSQSHDGASTTPSSTPSASSFLKRLTGTGNRSFNIAQSSVDRQSKAWNVSGGNSLYTSGSSSAASGTPPRSPSASVENSGRGGPVNMNAEYIRIRLHLLVSSAKWQDLGNCILQVRRPPPGWQQALRADHGLEKRITVLTQPRKEGDTSVMLLDAVLGSGCFSSMGSRGIVCGVWEEVKNDAGQIGMVPETGATGGVIKKWCFQFGNAAEAGWVLRLVHQEVLGGY